MVLHNAANAFFGSDPDDLAANLPALHKNFTPFFETLSDDQFLFLVTDPGLRSLYADVNIAFPDTNALHESIRTGFTRMRSAFPSGSSVAVTKVYPYVSNLDQYPVIVSDSTYVFLALDLFLGADHPAYAQQSSYLAYAHEPRFAVPSLFQALAQERVIEKEGSLSLVDQMLYWGRILCITEMCIGSENARNILPYTPEQWAFCEEHEAELWRYFVENRLLFEQGIAVDRRFIDPAPFSKLQTSYDQQIPGMIGRWLGYRWVKHYMTENPEVTWSSLAQMTDSRTLLNESNYRP